MEPQKPDSLACSPTRYVYVDETRRRLGRLPDDIGACLDIAKAPPRLHLHTVRDKSICQQTALGIRHKSHSIMSIPNAALQKLLQEVEAQAIQSQQKIAQTQQEIATKKRDARLNQLTVSELSNLEKDTPIYEGVGKMCGHSYDCAVDSD